MADKLTSLIDAAVQTEVDKLLLSLKDIQAQITNISNNGIKVDGTGTAAVRKYVDDLRTANDQLATSQQKIIDLTNQLAAAQKVQQQTTQNSATRMSALTENSKLLQKALDDVKKQLTDGIAAGKLSADQQSKLAGQTEVLTTLVNQQAKGFSSLNAEVRAGERALQTMREAGLQNTAAFKELQLSTASTRREFNNFAREQKILSSEAPAIQALTTVARGLGGAYAAGAGAAALFGDENGKIAKEFEKLVAVMTLLKGITELNAAIQQKNAIATSLSVMWNKALTFVYGEEAVAAATATEATGAFYAVLTGGILLGVGLLVAGIVALTSSNKEAAKSELELSEATDKTNESIQKQVELVGDRYKNSIDKLKDEISAAQAAGESEDKLFAKRKALNDLLKKENDEKLSVKIAQAEKEYADAGLKGMDALNASRAGHLKKYQQFAKQLSETNGKIQEDLELIHKADPNDTSVPKYVKDLQEQAKNLQSRADNEKKYADSIIKLTEETGKIKSEGEDLQLTHSKLTAEEQRKLNLQVEKEKSEAVIHSNEIILQNEDSTQKQRLQASKNISDEQIKLIKAERDEKLKDPGLTPLGRATVEQAANAAMAKARIEGREKLQKINEDYAKRDLAAFYALNNARLDAQKNFDENIIQSDAHTYDEKLRATLRRIKDDKAIEDARYNEQFLKKGLTDTEKLAIEAEHQTKLAEIAQKGENDLLRIKEDAQKRLADEAKAHNDGYMARINADEARQLNLLNGLYLDGAISIEKYAEAKKKLENANRIKILQAEIAEQERLFKATNDVEERLKIKATITGKDAQISDLKVKKAEDAETKRKKGIDEAVAYEKEGAELTNAIVDSQFEKRKNEIQHEIDLIDMRKEADVNAINASSLNAQEKAAQIFNAEKTNAQQKEKLQRDQRNEDIRKAKFDKDTALFQAIINLAADVVKMGVITPEAVATEIAGLSQIGIIAARQIPKYQHGTDSAIGGLSLVGEAGKEIRITPSGEMSFTPGVPTYMNLNKGDKIIPNHKKDDYIMNLISQSLNIPDVKRIDTEPDLRVLQGLSKIEKAITRQKPTNVSFKSDGAWREYIERET